MRGADGEIVVAYFVNPSTERWQCWRTTSSLALLHLLLLLAAVPSTQFSAVTRCAGPRISTAFQAISISKYPEIGGLLPDEEFERCSAIDETIVALRRQIPSLLTVPLSDESAAEIYSSDTRLTVGIDDSVELAADRAELISISNAIVLTFAASSRAASFFASFGRASSANEGSGSFSPKIESKLALIIDPNTTTIDEENPLHIQVHWEADILPAQQSAASGSISTIKGISLLQLDPKTAKITSHRLQKIYSNGSYRDPEAVGQSLATLRQTVKGFQDAPLLQPLLSSNSPQSQSALSILKQVTEEFIQQQLVDGEKADVLSPLFVVTSDCRNATSLNNATDTSQWVPIEEYSSPSPLPGSDKWISFQHIHRATRYFVNTLIPALAGTDEKERSIDIESLFAPNCEFTTLDGSTLMQGGYQVSNFFSALSVFRQRTFGRWTLTSASVSDWKVDGNECSFSILVNYTAINSIAGSTSTTTVKGADLYVLSSDIPESRNEVSPGVKVVIEKVQQKRFSVGEQSTTKDGVRFMRSLVIAVESGRFRSPSSDDSSFWTDLLLRATEGNRDGNASTEPVAHQRLLPVRTDSQAATVYRVMERLHLDCATLVSLQNPDDKARRPSSSLPALDFMAQNVKLRGYLNEPLLSGKNNYKQNLGLFVASFRAALRSGRVVSEKEPKVRVELASTGNIRCSLALFLKVLPGIAGLSELIGPEASAFPLRIDLKSEYVLSDETGWILQHRLLESKVNGQLTPGDVISRWIRQLSGGEVESDDISSSDWARGLQETLKWVQSVRS